MTSQTKNSPFALRNVAINLAAGGSAGFCEICIMHPLDVVKTRLQLQKSGGNPADPHFYTSVFDCLRKTARHEGLTALYKGVIPPVLVETPKRAVKFLTFQMYKELMGASNPVTYFVAGLGSGVTEAILVNPFEVVKVAQQANKAKHSATPGPFVVAREIIAREGILGLNKGMTATIGRNGTFNMVYFGLFHTINTEVLSPRQENWQNNLQKFFVGFGTGVLACILNIPFDVAKSRIQGPQADPRNPKYRGTLSSIAIVYKEEGFMALYKGLVPKVLRLGPGAGIMMIVYESVYNFLVQRYPQH
ncbi:mitochondrial 2-oxodicarboxylate carrier [Hyalella azteca]|uniref:Mitochondrial 2-oxodicarboxylate carrier n=1 Tax=Hyalella azteca TaxID=294128 RepID=A0A8B7PP06_HYAAZ|nr:mitochondrial 2-oxodicarboxylate carrier [Hyalella azteca]